MVINFSIRSVLSVTTTSHVYALVLLSRHVICNHVLGLSKTGEPSFYDRQKVQCL